MESTKQPTLIVEADDYLRLLERVSEEHLPQAFIGTWRDRESFGLELLGDGQAERRLQQLPGWLQPYVRLDGTRFVNDMEAAGYYVVVDTKRGICVLDGPIVRQQD